MSTLKIDYQRVLLMTTSRISIFIQRLINTCIYIKEFKIIIQDYNNNSIIQICCAIYNIQLQENPKEIDQKKIVFDQVKPLSNKQGQYLQYQYPVRIMELPTFPSPAKQNFKNFMQQESRGRKYQKNWNINTFKLKNKTKRIIYRCLNCKAYIKFDQTENQAWKVVEYKINHQHRISKKKDQQRLVEQAFLERLQNFSEPQKKFEKKMIKNHAISPYVLKKVKYQIFRKNHFEILKKYLRHHQYHIRYELNQQDIKKEGLPDTLVAISTRDKLNYQQFGQCVCYNISYNCVKQLSFTQKKYGIGIFSGFDCNNRALIFGFSLNAYQRKQDFKNIFSWFFEIMDNKKNTTAIITKQQQSIINSLKQLKIEKNYNYLFVKQYKSKMETKQNKYSKIFQNLLKTMKEPDPEIGKDYQQILKLQMDRNGFEKQYNELLTKFENICLWRFPKQFLGLSQHSNIQINTLLKVEIENQLDLIKVVQRINQISKQNTENVVNRRIFQKYKFEQLYENKYILQVREKFEKKVFNTFIVNYRKSQLYKLINPHIKQSQKYEIVHLKNYRHYVIYNWKCVCGATQKIGIPCQHLIFLQRKLQQKKGYIQFFHSRWITKRKLLQQDTQRGRRSKKRSNMKN